MAFGLKLNALLYQRAQKQPKMHFFNIFHSKPYGTKFDHAIKQIQVNPGSSFISILKDYLPRCYILSLKAISQVVLEKKIFLCFLSIWVWRPSWLCDLDEKYSLSFPLCLETAYKI